MFDELFSTQLPFIYRWIFVSRLLFYRNYNCSDEIYSLVQTTSDLICRYHPKTLNRFHQKCFRHILNIKWHLGKFALWWAKAASMEKPFILNQLRWAGHLRKMSVCLSNVSLLVSARGTYSRNVLRMLKKQFENSGWKKLFFDSCTRIKLRRALRNRDVDSVPEDIQPELPCHICGIVLSHAGLSVSWDLMNIGSLITTMQMFFPTEL